MVKTKCCQWCGKEFQFDTTVRFGNVRYDTYRCLTLARCKRRREAYANGKK